MPKENAGWIKLHRSSFDNILYFKEKFTLWQAWCDLLLLANYKPSTVTKRGITIQLQPGQVGYSQDELAKRWKWSRSKVYRFLEELEDEKKISFSSYKKNMKTNMKTNMKNEENEHQNEHQNLKLTTCITILNYCEEQNIEHKNEHENEEKKTSKRTQNRTLTINNNNIEEQHPLVSVNTREQKKSENGTENYQQFGNSQISPAELYAQRIARDNEKKAERQRQKNISGENEKPVA